ncbi:CAP domain-containing protein [Candidatus Kaiserbacteria bacterium]|nr:CAP domain-containing protein [Candidatus Kaiserbacteria bacterium]
MMKRFRRLKHYLVPHKGNKFKPAVFAKESVAVLVFALFLVQSLYFFGTHIVLKNTGFTAAVLPAALTDLTNADRAAAGHARLTPDAHLTQAAQKKAEDMAAKGYFAHISPEGKSPWYWLDAVGYEYTYAGENLAINFTDSLDVEEGWMNSPAHHANIVKPEYTQIGIGTAQGIYEGKETTFVVELFAALPDKAEVATVPKTAPQQKNVVAAAATPQASPAPAEESRVLGTQVESSASGAPTLAAVASSPGHVIRWIFGIFAVLVSALLGVAIFAKRKVHYLEAAGGVVLIGVALALVFFNGSGVSGVELPRESQGASVSLAL